MPRISIARIDQSPLEFAGELLVRSASEMDDHGRHYIVSIYRMEPGDAIAYVPCVEYGSNASDEACFTIAEVVESVEDVEKYFYVFEPLEHLQCKNVDSMSAQARQTFTQELFRLYDSAVARSLGKFSILVATHDQKMPSNPT